MATDRTLAALPRTSLLPLLRHVFSKAASWCLFHVEYMDSLVAILRALGTNTVLEVCAGSGTLIEPMRLRGLTWHAADARPPPHAYGVMAAQAIDAIRNTDLMPTGTQGRVVFWSWWSTAAQSKKRKAQTYPVQAADDAALMAEAPPLSPPEDVLVVRESLARGDIIIFVGEPRGGLQVRSHCGTGLGTFEPRLIFGVNCMRPESPSKDAMGSPPIVSSLPRN